MFSEPVRHQILKLVLSNTRLFVDSIRHHLLFQVSISSCFRACVSEFVCLSSPTKEHYLFYAVVISWSACNRDAYFRHVRHVGGFSWYIFFIRTYYTGWRYCSMKNEFVKVTLIDDISDVHHSQSVSASSGVRYERYWCSQSDAAQMSALHVSAGPHCLPVTGCPKSQADRIR